MIYQIDKIMRDVRTAMDENADNRQLLYTHDADTIHIDRIIKSHILPAIEKIHLAVPSHMLEQGHIFADSVYWSDMQSGWVLLPDDFLRLIVFEMSDWQQPVYQAITTDDPQYPLQHSRIKALRGTPERPVCALAIRPEGRVLEFYSCRSCQAFVTRAIYMPYPTFDQYQSVDISQRCYHRAIATAAAMTLNTLGETERAKDILSQFT